MLRAIEREIIEIILWFFQLSPLVQFFSFAPLATILLIIQYQKQKETIVPGISGLVCGYISILHFSWQKGITEKLTKIVELLSTPHKGGFWGARPLPNYVEDVFAFLAAPANYRFVPEEVVVVFLIGYLVSVCYYSYRMIVKGGSLNAKPIFNLFGAGKLNRPTRSKDNELGSGDFATTEQITKWLKPSGKKGDTILNVTNIRGDQGVLYKEAKFHIPSEERNRHILAVAKTGSGKTTKLILPILYNDCLCPDRTTIVIDSKPEMWRKLAAMTKKYCPEKEIILFNPLDRLRSLSWNILSKIEDDTDAKLIANTIIMATDNKNSKSDTPFFRNNALSVLNAIMVGLLNDPNETLSMPRIHELVQSGMKSLCDWLEVRPEAIRNTRTFVELARSGSQNADTIMSELSMRLSAWDLASIRATTGADEIDLEKLISKPCLFVIELRESELEMLRPMANVIVIEILRYLTKRAESCPGTSLPRPVSLVIDEFASALGRLPDIHVKLNTLRSRNVSIVAAVQSLAQIKANYAEDAESVIAGFSTKIFMPSLDTTDAEWASKESGQMTIRFHTKSSGSNKKLVEVFASKNDSRNEIVQQRAVLTPDEIGRPTDNIATFFFPNTPVFQGFLEPHYKIPEMIKRITEFDSESKELKLRSEPIPMNDSPPPMMTFQAVAESPPHSNNGVGRVEPQNDGFAVPNAVGNEVSNRLDNLRHKIGVSTAEPTAKNWWNTFETENASSPIVILKLAEELAKRNATVDELFYAFNYSNSVNIQANLYYLDYLRLQSNYKAE